MVLCITLMISLGICASAISRPFRSPSLSYDNELSKIDALRQRYYDLESEIWREVKKSDNQLPALRKIHEGHLAFYAEPLEIGVDFSLFETGEKDLLHEIKFINDSVLSATKKNLHKNERNFVRAESLELAGTYREFIRAMDAINNVTKGNDLFGTIKKVRKMLSNNNLRSFNR